MAQSLKNLPAGKLNAIMQIAELFQSEDSKHSDRSKPFVDVFSQHLISFFVPLDTELLSEILQYVKGIYEILTSTRNDEDSLLQPKKTGKRKAMEPLTANKIKRSLADLEESYQQHQEDDEGDSEPQFEVVEYQGSEGIVLETVDVKPFTVKERKSGTREFDFPLTEVSQVDALEEEIGRSNSHIRKHLIETIHTIQGNIKDHRVTIRTFLRVIFTDPLLAQYTWKGYESKQALCGYKNLITFLKKILVRWFPDDDLSDFVKIIQNHIKNVPSRLSKSKRDDE